VTSAPRSTHEVTIPAEAVSGKERVGVEYTNLDDRAVAVVFPPGGVELLVPAHGFAANLLRAFLIFGARTSFIVALGLALATVLDGKVATLGTLSFVVIGAAHAFLDEAVGPIVARSATDRVFGPADAVVKAILSGVLELVPDLSAGDPAAAVQGGLAVSGVAAALLGLALARSAIVLVLGALALSRREIGGRE